jgi:two-component system heavy metal sensor histidine kinase CusS
MKSLGVRLTLWHTVLSTVTLFGLLAVGYLLLNRHLVRGVDALNAAEFQRLDPAGPQTWLEDAAGFFLEIRDAEGRVVARSPGLPDTPLPTGEAAFTASVGPLGPLRFGVFPRGGFTVIVASSLRPVQAVMEGYAEISIVLICVVLGVSLVSGLLLSRVALRPLRLIRETANRIRHDNLGARIPVSDVEDEVNSLARLLNDMFDRLETAFRQVQRFSAEASHELKTPLALMRLQAEKLLTDGGLTVTQEETVTDQLEEIARMNQIIEELLFLARAESRSITVRRKDQDPREFLQNFLSDARLLAEEKNVALHDATGAPGSVAFDPRWMRQVLLNLLSNALKITPPGGVISVESEFAGDIWRLAVEDDGPGLPEADHERIFQRFVKLGSGKPGTGLGLAICRSVLQMHDGTIRAQTGPRRGGLRVVCEMPRQVPG